MKKLLLIGFAVAFLSVSTLAFAQDVFVTKSGKKYHTADCRTIKNKDVTSMTEKEAVAQGYEPCRRCLKEKYEETKAEKKSKKSVRKKSSKSKRKKKSK